MIRSVSPVVAVLAVVVVAVEPEPFAQIFLLLSGNLGVFLGEQIGANTVGPGLVLGVQLGYDDPSGVVGGSIVKLPLIDKGVELEPSELLRVPLELGLLLV